MTHLADEQIEDAFAQIRAKFEKRNNETGLDILDSYEEQWDANQNLSDRQCAWLEKQLDGSWKQNAEPATKSVNDGGTRTERESDIIQFPSMDRDMEQRIDAMISRKLEEPSKTVVDLKRLDELEETIDGLKQAVRAMR